MKQNLSAVAVCDPRVIMGALFADEAAYNEKHLDLRITWDTATLPTLACASFLFDKIIGDPVLLEGLKPLLGYEFTEIFGGTLKKVQDAEFIDFKPANYVDENRKNDLKRLQDFLSEIHGTERIVGEIANDTAPSISAPIENALLYSKLSGLPFVGMNDHGPDTESGPHGSSTTPHQFTILKQILSIELPNLQINSLDDVLSIRATKGARDFRLVIRTLMAELTAEIEANEPELKTIMEKWNRIKNQAADLLVDEFRSDINGWSNVKGGLSVLLDIVGFIPAVSVITGTIGAVKDSAELLKSVSKRKKLKELGFLCFLAELRGRSSKKG